MTTLYNLMDKLENCLKISFLSKNDKKALQKNVYDFIESLTKTEQGNNRYPKKYTEALHAYYMTRIVQLENDNLIFCYEVDGKLYTTFNKYNRAKYYFKGETDIPNYRDIEGIEEKILHAGHNGSPLVSGLYYPCGKVYFNSEYNGN